MKHISRRPYSSVPAIIIFAMAASITAATITDSIRTLVTLIQDSKYASLLISSSSNISYSIIAFPGEHIILQSCGNYDTRCLRRLGYALGENNEAIVIAPLLNAIGLAKLAYNGTDLVHGGSSVLNISDARYTPQRSDCIPLDIVSVNSYYHIVYCLDARRLYSCVLLLNHSSLVSSSLEPCHKIHTFVYDSDLQHISNFLYDPDLNEVFFTNRWFLYGDYPSRSRVTNYQNLTLTTCDFLVYHGNDIIQAYCGSMNSIEYDISSVSVSLSNSSDPNGLRFGCPQSRKAFLVRQRQNGTAVTYSNRTVFTNGTQFRTGRCVMHEGSPFFVLLDSVDGISVFSGMELSLHNIPSFCSVTTPCKDLMVYPGLYILVVVSGPSPAVVVYDRHQRFVLQQDVTMPFSTVGLVILTLTPTSTSIDKDASDTSSQPATEYTSSSTKQLPTPDDVNEKDVPKKSNNNFNIEMFLYITMGIVVIIGVLLAITVVTTRMVKKWKPSRHNLNSSTDTNEEKGMPPSRYSTREETSFSENLDRQLNESLQPDTATDGDPQVLPPTRLDELLPEVVQSQAEDRPLQPRAGAEQLYVAEQHHHHPTGPTQHHAADPQVLPPRVDESHPEVVQSQAEDRPLQPCAGAEQAIQLYVAEQHHHHPTGPTQPHAADPQVLPPRIDEPHPEAVQSQPLQPRAGAEQGMQLHVAEEHHHHHPTGPTQHHAAENTATVNHSPQARLNTTGTCNEGQDNVCDLQQTLHDTNWVMYGKENEGSPVQPCEAVNGGAIRNPSQPLSSQL